MTHLPEDIQKSIDLNNLKFQSRAHIDSVRKESIVDVLYKTTVKEQAAYLYLLLEHQSTPDELMAFRLLKYSCNIMEEHLKNAKKKRLPLVYPMVLYHAKRPYPYSTDIKDIIDAPRTLIDQYFLKPFQLIDLSQIDDEKLKQRSWSGAMNIALKYAYANDLASCLKALSGLLHDITLSDDEDYIGMVLQYICGYSKLETPEAFHEFIQTTIPLHDGETYMSINIVKYFKDEGRSEGITQGQLTEKTRIARCLLAEGADIDFVARITGLAREKLHEFQESLTF